MSSLRSPPLDSLLVQFVRYRSIDISTPSGTAQLQSRQLEMRTVGKARQGRARRGKTGQRQRQRQRRREKASSLCKKCHCICICICRSCLVTTMQNQAKTRHLAASTPSSSSPWGRAGWLTRPPLPMGISRMLSVKTMVPVQSK